MSDNHEVDVFPELPDLPRWVDARGMLLAKRGFLTTTTDGCKVVCSRRHRMVVPITFDLSRELDRLAHLEIPGATIVLQEVMLPSARWLLPEWEAEAAAVFALELERTRHWAPSEWPAAAMTTAQIEAADHVPPALRDVLADASTRSSVWTVSAEGQPLAFAWAMQSTERWFQAGVETLESGRGRGLGRAALMALVRDRAQRGLRPVLRVPGRRPAGVRLARRLGFDAVDLHWLLTRTA
jgi:GNAT superfamily N-acetyltransferase